MSPERDVVQEELDKLEQQDQETPEKLAQETLDETKPPEGEQQVVEKAPEIPPEKPAETKPVEDKERTGLIGQIAELREKNRVMQQQLDTPRQQPVQEQPIQPGQATKSPMESKAEQLGCTVDDVPVDGRLYGEQRLWENQQVETASQLKKQNVFNASYQRSAMSMGDLQKGQGLGLEALYSLGGHLLTAGDKLDIYNSSENCGQVTYSRLKQRIMESGGDIALILQGRVKAHSSKPEQDKPSVSTEKVETKEKTEKTNETELGLRPATSEVAGFVFSKP